MRPSSAASRRCNEGSRTGSVPARSPSPCWPATASCTARRGALDGAETGGGHLDVVQAERRVDDDRAEVEILAHDLAVDLAGGGYVDDGVADDAGRATEAVAGIQRAVAVVVDLDGRRRAQGVGRGVDRPLGEAPDARCHLATAADAAPSAHRVEVGAQGACCLQHRRSVGDLALQPGGREHDSVELGHVVHCERASASERVASNGLRGRGTQWTVNVTPGAGAGPPDRRAHHSARWGRGWRGSTLRSRGRCRPGRRPPSPPTSPPGAAGS